MLNLIKQSTTSRPLLFLMTDTADHVSAKTGLAPTVVISKNGAAFASPAGAVTELANGWYKVAGNATDTDTLGTLILHASATGADPTDSVYEVVAIDVTDATAFGLSRLDAAISSRNATAPDNTSIATILTRTDVATSTRASATDYTTARAAKLDNLDATVSSRNSTTPPTAAAIRSEMDTNSTKLDVAVSTRNATTPPTVGAIRTELDANSTKLANLDTNVASRSSHTAADVWAVGTRTLTGFGTLVADIATAVWGAASRTLSAFGFTVAPTPSQNAAAVWSEALPGSYTSGQAGYKLNAAGSAADPFLNPVPGSYPSGTAGYYLGRLAVSSITVTAPVLTGGNVSIVRGDSYYSVDGRALIWTITGVNDYDFAGAVTTFKAKKSSSPILTKDTDSTVGGVAVSYNSGASTLTITLELDTTDTSTLSFGDYTFDIQTEFTNSHVETWIVGGKMTVIADVR